MSIEKHLQDKRIDNTWAVIKLSELPDDMPVFAVSEMHNKAFAEFHLIEYCLIPKELLKHANKDERSDASKVEPNPEPSQKNSI